MRKITLLYALNLLILLSNLVTLGYADTITIVSDTWCPYNCEPESEKPGIFIELAEKIFKEAGHNIVYKKSSWSRAISDARNGKINAISGAFKVDAPDFIFPSYTPFKATDSFYKLNSNPWKFSGISSLSSQTLGIIQDHAYAGELQEYIDKNKNNYKLVQIVKGDNPLKLNITKLLAGRITVFLNDSNVVSHYLRSESLADKIVLAGEYNSEDCYLAFSPAISESKKYADIYAKGARKLFENGDYQLIIKKYGID